MHIFFSVGEPSGDQHAAHLIYELRRRRPELRFSGYGGPLMQQAGCRLNFRLTDLAVMGFLRVLPLLWQFVALVRRAGRLFREDRPDAVVLVDFPGFNWWIARKAKAAGIPVFYYMPPQLWAWAPWRVRRVRKYVDYVLSGLSFEAEWYAQRGVAVEYVGHPFFDEVAESQLDGKFLSTWTKPDETVVGLLPGSRNHEVEKNFPMMMDVVGRLHARHPHVRFLAACYKPAHLRMCREYLQQLSTPLPVQLFVGKTSEIIQASRFCLMVSGSVSLEMLARKTPAVVIYCCSRAFHRLCRLIVSVDSITLPNLMSGRNVLPEYGVIGRRWKNAEKVFGVMEGWLQDPNLLRLSTEQLAEIYDQFVQPGATERTADAILRRLPATSVARAA